MDTTAERFVLEDRIFEGSGGTYWRGTDQVLARSVGVLVLAAGHPQEDAVLEAARRAAAVSDARFLGVLDADRVDGQVRVVSEWVRAVDLVDLLAHGPLAPDDAVSIVEEVAGALTVAHDHGIGHRCLDPRSVLRTDSGGVKVVGLGIDAALAGLDPLAIDEAGPEDARGLGALLFAGLTARWPFDDGVNVGVAPVPGGARSVRQVRAGLPAGCDLVTGRALGPKPYAGLEPLASPAAVLSALHGLRRDGSADNTPRPPHKPVGPQVKRGVAAVVGLAILVVLAVVAFSLVAPPEEGPEASGTGPTTGFTGPGGTPSPTPGGNSVPQLEQGATIPVAGISDFDPEGDGEESSSDAPLAVDGNPATSWQTTSYKRRPDLGGLKSGVGLVLDLGSVQRVGAVAVELVGVPTTVELRAAEVSQPDATGYQLVGKVTDAPASATLVPTGGSVDARYLLLWLTSLPREGVDFRGGIAEVTVRAP